MVQQDTRISPFPHPHHRWGFVGDVLMFGSLHQGGRPAALSFIRRQSLALRYGRKSTPSAADAVRLHAVSGAHSA